VAQCRHVTLKEKPTHVPSFRVHRIDTRTTVADLQSDLREQLGHPALKIVFVNYRERQDSACKLAVCEATPELYEAARKRSSLRVGWHRCRLDTSILVPRCTKCKLLGHVEKHCTDSAVRPSPTCEEPCIDCSAHNARIREARLPRTMQRRTDHATNDGSRCQTRANLIRKRGLSGRPILKPSAGMEVTISPPSGSVEAQGSSHGDTTHANTI
jgi:hypothetical protein